MTELEQALGRLPEDTAFAPEPFPEIETRAARRRRRRWQGRGAASGLGVVALAVALSALPSDRGRVVDTAGGPAGGGGLPATGGSVEPATAAKVVAEGNTADGNWRLLARPSDNGLCLDVDYGGRTSSECGVALGAGQAIAGGLTTGLDLNFLRGVVRKDVASVHVDLERLDPFNLPPVGADQGFDVNFYVTPVAGGMNPVRAMALDQAGAVLGTIAIDPEAGFTIPDDEIAAPMPPTSSLPPNRVPPSTALDPDGSQSSPIQPIPSDPIAPPGPDPSLTACPPAEVAVTVTTGKASYAVGETVTGSSTLENRSSAACLVPARVRFAVEDQAGNDVSGFAYTADFALPVKAEPGQSFPGTFTWNQNNCRDLPCLPVAPGTYVLVGRWSEGGSFSAQTTFQIGP